MSVPLSRIFLSTPLRDEATNIERLFASVAAQNISITLWVIVENGSTDGSRDLLARVRAPANVEQLIILNENTESGDYALGHKYARLVKRGFDEIQSRVALANVDLIGILDADCFPMPTYYETLTNAFVDDPKLGIASGSSIDESSGKASIAAKDWVRGGARLWRGSCFLQSGYIIGPSADTLSLARAELDGWTALVVDGAIFITREVGARSNYEYYGSSAYFRGNTPLYAVLRCCKLAARGHFANARGFALGYIRQYRDQSPQIADSDILRYFQTYLRRKVIRKLRTLV